MAKDDFVPVKKYTFPAGECGGEIRINIPSFASKEEVEIAAAMIKVIADHWKDPDNRF